MTDPTQQPSSHLGVDADKLDAFVKDKFPTADVTVTGGIKAPEDLPARAEATVRTLIEAGVITGIDPTEVKVERQDNTVTVQLPGESRPHVIGFRKFEYADLLRREADALCQQLMTPPDTAPGWMMGILIA